MFGQANDDYLELGKLWKYFCHANRSCMITYVFLNIFYVTVEQQGLNLSCISFLRVKLWYFVGKSSPDNSRYIHQPCVVTRVLTTTSHYRYILFYMPWKLLCIVLSALLLGPLCICVLQTRNNVILVSIITNLWAVPKVYHVYWNLCILCDTQNCSGTS